MPAVCKPARIAGSVRRIELKRGDRPSYVTNTCPNYRSRSKQIFVTGPENLQRGRHGGAKICTGAVTHRFFRRALRARHVYTLALSVGWPHAFACKKFIFVDRDTIDISERHPSTLCWRRPSARCSSRVQRLPHTKKALWPYSCTTVANTVYPHADGCRASPRGRAIWRSPGALPDTDRLPACRLLDDELSVLYNTFYNKLPHNIIFMLLRKCVQ